MALVRGRPLTPVSEEGKEPASLPVDTVLSHRQVKEKTLLPSLMGYGGYREHPFSPFEVDADGYGEGDDFWLDLIAAGLPKWPIQLWLHEVYQNRTDAVVWTSDSRFEGWREYDPEQVGGVTEATMYALLSGACTEPLFFLFAEGLLARVMLVADEMVVRLMAFNMWRILVGRFCGTQAADDLAQASELLRGLPSHYSACPMPSDGIFESMQKYSMYVMRRDSAWSRAFGRVSRVREAYLGDLCFDSRHCALHDDRCADYVGNAEVTWESDTDSD